MKKLLLLPIFAMFMALCGAASAQSVDSSSPDVLIKTVTQQVLDEIKSDPKIQSGDIAKITELVNQKILPYTDFTRTTRLVMGRNWNSATPEQQKQIVEQFKMLLIRTYSGALAQVRNQTVQYKPFRANPDDTDVVVRSVVMNNGSPVELDYRLYKTAARLARVRHQRARRMADPGVSTAVQRADLAEWRGRAAAVPDAA